MTSATIQAGIAMAYGGNYALALAIVTAIALVVTIVITALGKEAKNISFGNTGNERDSASDAISIEAIE